MTADHKSWDESSGADLDELRRLAKKAVLPDLLASFLAATAADSRTRVDELRFVVDPPSQAIDFSPDTVEGLGLGEAGRKASLRGQEGSSALRAGKETNFRRSS
jgi:hypothetical protein